MDTARPDRKAATAARIYDYFIGGTHNFPADRAAAQEAIRRVPAIPAAARANRAFLARAVAFAANAGIRQFLDIGSGIPTEGNVHEIAQEIIPDARVVYVDIDPVAVSEGLEILENNEFATSIRGDLQDPEAILGHPEVKRLLDFNAPIALLLCAVLHFVADDAEATRSVSRLRAALPAGSFLIISHATPPVDVTDAKLRAEHQDSEDLVQSVYTRQTTTPFRMRERAAIASFFGDFELVDPGLVWVPEWHPAASDPTDFRDDLTQSGIVAGVATLR